MPLTPQEALFIFNHTLGCRYGTTIDGAAYGFMDIVGAGADGGDRIVPLPTLRAWLTDPSQPQFEPRWHNRLWNTCGMIVGLSPAGNVMLVTKASPTAERYHFNSPLARGDGYSFRKCNRLPPNAAILANIAYGVGASVPEAEDITAIDNFDGVDARTVKYLYDTILATIKKLTDKAFA
ncbi:hypothetical protein [Sphingomonas sp. GV3]|uniref:hypothetical protein n=1 Tax=Sphingomonas sp. GV3 TaxID=3040671 RepID=UPI00280A7347|nr:hypothetical protein [Sphingomonas sp. GV3]